MNRVHQKIIFSLLSLALAMPLALRAQEAGQVLLAIGPALLVASQSGETPLSQGATLKVGDRIKTGPGGYVHVRMKDGGLLAVRPQSTLEIEVFEYDPAAVTQGKVRYRLLNGAARSVTGAIGQANKKGFRFNTPVAAIGVKGTDFVASTTAEKTLVSVNQGAVVVAALGPQCAASGYGVCGAGLQLAAGGQNGFIEVNLRTGQVVLRHDMENSPAIKSPAHPNEPLARREERNTDEVAKVLETKAGDAAAMSSAVHWGRWGAPNPAAPGTTVSELAAQGKSIHLASTFFGLGVEQLPDRLPASGQASFLLSGGEAHLRTAAGAFEAASLGAGRLNVNFGAAEFSLVADVLAAGQTHALQAAGRVDRGGYLLSDSSRSNATVNTVINHDLRQAGSLFQKAVGAGDTVFGAINWRR